MSGASVVAPPTETRGTGGYRREAAAAALFLAVSLVIRASSFFQSAIDWDESLYAIGGANVAAGHLPYVGVWDNKPPGIQLVFALGMLIFRNATVTLRLFSAIAVAIGAYAIYRLADESGVRRGLAYGAGLLYCVLTLANGGLAANTELFFIPLSTFAFILLWRAIRLPPAESPRRLLISAGVLLALGFQIKYLVVFDGMAAGVVWMLASRPWTGRDGIRRTATGLLALALPAVLLTVAVALTFWMLGAWPEFYQTQIAANYLNSADTPFDAGYAAVVWFDQLKTDAVVWAGVVLLAWNVATRTLPAGIRAAAVLLLIWLVGDIPAVFFTKLMWPHYFMQLYPPLCVGTALATEIQARHRQLIPVFLLLVLLIAAPIRNRLVPIAPATLRSLARWGRGDFRPDDLAARVADAIRPDVAASDSIYVVDTQPIIYLLAGARLPTRYPFPPNLIGTHSNRMADVDALAELAHIFSQAPTFVLRKHERPDPAGTSDEFYSELDRRLRGDYSLVRRVEDIDIYRINSRR